MTEQPRNLAAYSEFGEPRAVDQAQVPPPSLRERYLARDAHATANVDDLDWHYTLEEQAHAAGFDYLVDEFRDIDEIWQRGLGREVGDLYQDHLIEEETKALLVPRLVDLLRHTAAALRDGDPLVQLKSRAIIDLLFADVPFRTYRYEPVVDAAFLVLLRRIDAVGILPKLPVIYPEREHPDILAEEAEEREASVLERQPVIDEREPALIPTQYYEVTSEHGAVVYDRLEQIRDEAPPVEEPAESKPEQATWIPHDPALFSSESVEDTWLKFGRPLRSGSRVFPPRKPWHTEGL